MSSSGHVAAAEALLGAPAPEPVGLHAGSLAAVVVGYRAEAVAILRRLDGRRLAMHIAAGAIPSGVGVALERREPRLPLVPGLVAGAALLALGGRRGGTRSRWDAGPADGVWLGLAQAAAFWPGVSRNGATLAVARLRGFAPEEANPLSREVGVPVTAGALVLRRARPGLPALASFAGLLAARPLAARIDRGAPLWPWALERVALAALVQMRGHPQLRSSAPA